MVLWRNLAHPVVCASELQARTSSWTGCLAIDLPSNSHSSVSPLTVASKMSTWTRFKEGGGARARGVALDSGQPADKRTLTQSRNEFEGVHNSSKMYVELPGASSTLLDFPVRSPHMKVGQLNALRRPRQGRCADAWQLPFELGGCQWQPEWSVRTRFHSAHFRTTPSVALLATSVAGDTKNP